MVNFVCPLKPAHLFHSCESTVNFLTPPQLLGCSELHLQELGNEHEYERWREDGGIEPEPTRTQVRLSARLPTVSLGVTSTLKYHQSNNILLFPLQTALLPAKFVPFPPATTPPLLSPHPAFNVWVS